MGDRPVFVLGAGAQKAGTSFLHRALSTSPGVRMSDPKEMHVFDARFLPDQCGDFHERRKRALEERLGRGDAKLAPKRRETMRHALRHVLMHYDLSAYVDYFQELATSANVVGEITPSYSMLRAGHFSEIRELLEPHFDIKVIFLIREPVDRIFSAMRMNDRNLQRSGRTVATPAHERFRREFSAEPHERRTRYDQTISALERVFDADSIFYGFYESMFSQGFLKEAADFLGIDPFDVDLGQRVNASPTTSPLRQGDIDAARAHYDKVYRFVARKFGKEHVAALWQ